MNSPTFGTLYLPRALSMWRTSARCARLLERRVVQPDGRSRSNVDRELVRRTGMVDVLRGGRSLEELHRLASPAGDVARQLLEHGRRTLAPAVRQGVGDVASLAEGGLGASGHAGQRAHAEQVGDVGHDPFVAGLDEPVVVQPADVVLDQLHFAVHQVQQRTQRVALGRVAQPVHRREKREESAS